MALTPLCLAELMMLIQRHASRGNRLILFFLSFPMLALHLHLMFPLWYSLSLLLPFFFHAVFFSNRASAPGRPGKRPLWCNAGNPGWSMDTRRTTRTDGEKRRVALSDQEKERVKRERGRGRRAGRRLGKVSVRKKGEILHPLVNGCTWPPSN